NALAPGCTSTARLVCGLLLRSDFGISLRALTRRIPGPLTDTSGSTCRSTVGLLLSQIQKHIGLRCQFRRPISLKPPMAGIKWTGTPNGHAAQDVFLFMQ